MLPIIWLLGTSGVGKSTVGYRLLSHLGAAGVTAAFVDADQLRLVSAVQATQTDLIGAALPTMSDNYAAHGARALVVAGVLDDADHLTRLLPATSRSRVLAVALEADDDTIRERVHRRGWLTGLADAAVDHAARIDPEFADLRLDTTDRSPGELAGRLTDVAVGHIRRSGWRAAERTPQQEAGPTPPRMVVVTGPGGVGVSTAGFRTFSLLAHDGERVGYVDAHQLGLLGTEVRSDRLAPLRVANTRTVIRCLVHGGADTVVASGDPHTVRLLVDTRPAEPDESDPTTLFWLGASAAALADRLTERARGHGPVLQGDHRVGLCGDALEAAIAAAVHQNRYEPRPGAARAIDTSDRDPHQVAKVIRASLTSRHRGTTGGCQGPFGGGPDGP